MEFKQVFGLCLALAMAALVVSNSAKPQRYAQRVYPCDSIICYKA